MASVEDGTCEKTGQDSFPMVDENDKQVGEIPSLRILTPSVQLPLLSLLPCYVTKQDGLVALQ
jgi:hypothetical protein